MVRPAKRVAENRKARFDVAVDETLEAGIILTGDEIKSIRAGRIQLTGAYVKLLHPKRGVDALPQPVVVGMHLSAAAEPARTRGLLLHAREIRMLESEISAKGRTAVPLEVFFRGGYAKIRVGIGRGRKAYDKRELLRERDIARDQEQLRSAR